MIKKSWKSLCFCGCMVVLLFSLFSFFCFGAQGLMADTAPPEDIEYTILYLDSNENHTPLDTPNADKVLASELENGRVIHAPNTTKTGYAFGYWGYSINDPLDIEGGTNSTRYILTLSKAIQNADSENVVRIYAYWTELEYSVTTNYLGVEYGSPRDASAMSEANKKISINDSWNLELDEYEPYCSGHRFLGWYSTNEMLPTNKVEVLENITANVVLYGFFERLELYLVFADESLGLWPIEFRTMIDRAYDYHGQEGLLQDIKPVKEGYTFDGWYTSEKFSASTKVGAFYIFNQSENVVLHAKWVKNPSPIWWILFGVLMVVSIGAFLVWWLVFRKLKAN